MRAGVRVIGGVVAGRYRIVRQLGAGGMGAVYEALHTGTGRRVALKMILTPELAAHGGMVERFQREARAAGSIETRHIVQVLDSGVDAESGAPFLAMEFLRGEDLQQLVRRLGPLPPELALRIVGQACAGLAVAHQAGVIHRDIKPANIFLADGEDGEVTVKLLDFGIAKIKMDASDASSSEDRGLTRTGNMLGSPLYMSPEQAMGLKTIDSRTDVWSLGAVLYEALVGHSPHAHVDSLGLLIVTICSQPATPIGQIAPWVSAEVAAIAGSALEIGLDRRFQTATAMLEAIRRLLPGGLAVRRDMLVEGASPGSVSAPSRTQSLPTPISAPATVALPASDRSGQAAVGAVSGLGSAGIHSSAGLATTHGPGAATRRSALAPMLAVLGALALGVTGYAVWRQGTAAAPAGTASAPASPEAAPVVPPAVAPSDAPAEPAVAAVEERAAWLVVEPPSATVEVDGARAAVVAGKVEIRGPLGSTREVKVKQGARESTVVVAITAGGPLPDRVELRDAAPAPGRPGARPASPASSAARPAQPKPTASPDPDATDMF